VEIKAKGRTVRVVVPVKVGHKNLKDLVLGEIWRTAVHKCTSVVLKHQLIQGQFLKYVYKQCPTNNSIDCKYPPIFLEMISTDTSSVQCTYGESCSRGCRAISEDLIMVLE
jgi:hypothetical protein